MLVRSILLPTLVYPTLVATLALALLTLVWRSPLADRGRGASATGLALIVGYLGMAGLPRWPPVEATQRLIFVVGLALVAAWIVAPDRRGPVWIVRAVLAVAMLVPMLESPLRYTWSTGQAVLWLVSLFVLTLAVHAAWAQNLTEEGRVEDWHAAGVRLALLSALAGLLGLSGSALLAQSVGALTCGVGVVEVGSRVLGRRPWQGGAAPVLATAVSGLLLAGYFFAELTPVSVSCALLSLFLLGVPLGSRPIVRWVALVPLAIALGLTAWAAANEPEDPYADYYARATAPFAETREPTR